MSMSSLLTERQARAWPSKALSLDAVHASDLLGAEDAAVIV
jgi:hypothetical protein